MEAEMSETSPNRDQAARWGSDGGNIWVQMQPMLDDLMLPFERMLTDAGDPGKGGRVLDVGCGAGATTLAMARRVGTGGHCVGLDISRPLLAAARGRAAAEGVGNVDFIEADAQVHSLEPNQFDAVISRFGVMFFDDPAAAFANIHRSARPGAKLAFVAWRSPAENEFMTVATRTAAHLLPPMPAAEPDAPGQFAFADKPRVASILGTGGWSAIDLQPVDVPCRMPETALMTFATRLGPVGIALKDADAATVSKVAAALRPAFVPYLEGGYARFTAACWLARAEA
jgi:SAM-dependent methyltransferase